MILIHKTALEQAEELIDHYVREITGNDADEAILLGTTRGTTDRRIKTLPKVYDQIYDDIKWVKNMVLFGLQDYFREIRESIAIYNLTGDNIQEGLNRLEGNYLNAVLQLIDKGGKSK